MTPDQTGLYLTLTTGPSARSRDLLSWLRELAAATARWSSAGDGLIGRQADRDGLVSGGDTACFVVLHDVAVNSLDRVFATQIAHESSDPRSQEMLRSTLRREHRIYRPVAGPEYAQADEGGPAEVLNCVWWTPDPSAVEDFDGWYSREHIPLLMAIPGWRRIRRYELVDGTGPRYLAVHDIERSAIAAGNQPYRRAASDSEWRRRVVAARRQHDTARFSDLEVVGWSPSGKASE